MKVLLTYCKKQLFFVRTKKKKMGVTRGERGTSFFTCPGCRNRSSKKGGKTIVEKRLSPHSFGEAGEQKGLGQRLRCKITTW